MKTREEMKNFRPTSAMIRAAENCFAAMALTETIRPIVEGYQHEILEEEKYGYAEKHLDRRGLSGTDYITDPQHSYLMTDADFTHYMKRCNGERIAAGLHVDNEEYCPLLVAEHLQMQAEHAVIDAMAPVTGITRDQIFQTSNAMANLKKLIDLNLRFLSQFCDTKKTMKRFGIAA